MAVSDRQRWDRKYTGRSLPEEINPADWLVESVKGIQPGRALELACGIGHNAIWLAKSGWNVQAVDISPAGLKLGRRMALQHGQWVSWVAADLDESLPLRNQYDLVVVFRFLDRHSLPRAIQEILRPGGLLVYETFTEEHLHRSDNHLSNPDFVLRSGELPALFPCLTCLQYEEVSLADRSVARLAARK